MMSEKFIAMVDLIVKLSEHDPELKDCVRWVDERSKKTNSSFYETMYEILFRYETNIRAKDWLSER